MGAADEFRQLLEAGDVAQLRAAWKRLAPNMPQPETHDQAEIVMHYARTESRSVRFRCRAYSHRWLTERDLPSALPDDLRPRAERIYPRVVEAVGFSLKFRTSFMAPAEKEVRAAVANEIESCYADGRTDPEFVRQRMELAKRKAVKSLFGV